MKTFIDKLNLLIQENLLPNFDSKISIIKSLPEPYDEYIRMHRFVRVVKDEPNSDFELSRDVTIPADIPLFGTFKKKKTRFSFESPEDIEIARDVISNFIDLESIENEEFLAVRINSTSITCVIEFDLLTVDQSVDLLETVYISYQLHSALESSNDQFKNEAFELTEENDRLTMVHNAMQELETILCKICKDLKYHDDWIKNHAANFAYGRATNLGIAIQFMNRCYKFLLSVFEKEVAFSTTRIPIDILSLKYSTLKLEAKAFCQAISDNKHLDVVGNLLIDIVDVFNPKFFKHTPTFYTVNRLENIIHELFPLIKDCDNDPFPTHMDFLEKMIALNINSKCILKQVIANIIEDLSKIESTEEKVFYLKKIIKITRQNSIFKTHPLDPSFDHLHTMIEHWANEELSEAYETYTAEQHRKKENELIVVNGKLQDISVLIEILIAMDIFEDCSRSKLRQFFIDNTVLKSGQRIEKKSLEGAGGKPISLKDIKRYESWIQKMRNILQDK